MKNFTYTPPWPRAMVAVDSLYEAPYPCQELIKGQIMTDLYNFTNYSSSPLNSTSVPYLQKIAGDGSDRTFYRLLQNQKSLAIAMKFPSWAGGHGGSPEDWLKLQRWLQSQGLPVPQVFAEDKGSACIWIQDLGDDFLLQTGQKVITSDRTDVINLYKQALLLLLDLQYPKKSPPPPVTLSFDFEKLFFEIKFFVTHFLQNFLGMDITETTHPKLWQEWRSLCQWLSDQPRVLCHRDYQSRNLLVFQNSLFFIDFQDARFGPHAYDVVSLVRDCYVEMPWSLRHELFEFYENALHEKQRFFAKPILSKNDFSKEVLHMGLQRQIKALGSFGFLALQKHKKDFLTHVPRTLSLLLDPESHLWRGMSIEKDYSHTWQLLRDCQTHAKDHCLCITH